MCRLGLFLLLLVAASAHAAHGLRALRRASAKAGESEGKGNEAMEKVKELALVAMDSVAKV
jgi:hypothetical protein